MCTDKLIKNTCKFPNTNAEQGLLQRNLDWHLDARVPLAINFESLVHQVPAYIVGIDYDLGAMNVICIGSDANRVHCADRYTTTCGNISKGKFYAVGDVIHSDAGNLRLSLPNYIANQTAQEQHFQTDFLDRSDSVQALTLHLNHTTGVVTGITFDSISVRWPSDPGRLNYIPAQTTRSALLKCGSDSLELDTLRVAHISQGENGFDVHYALNDVNGSMVTQL
jgi:hypothetical protein